LQVGLYSSTGLQNITREPVLFINKLEALREHKPPPNTA